MRHFKFLMATVIMCTLWSVVNFMTEKVTTISRSTCPPRMALVV